MRVWRRKALELFPDLRNEIQRGNTTIYGVFSALRTRCRQAHREENREELWKIYDYAEWCFRQKTKDLWNAAGVSFYEHLGDDAATRDVMHIWLKADIFWAVVVLLEGRVKADELDAIKKRFPAPSHRKR